MCLRWITTELRSVTMDSKAAQQEMNSIMVDLQMQLKTANIKVENLSTIAKEGDEKVIKMSKITKHSKPIKAARGRGSATGLSLYSQDSSVPLSGQDQST